MIENTKIMLGYSAGRGLAYKPFDQKMLTGKWKIEHYDNGYYELFVEIKRKKFFGGYRTEWIRDHYFEFEVETIPITITND